MIKELQIRPFARPLLVWIAGAILQTVFFVLYLFLGITIAPCYYPYHSRSCLERAGAFLL